MSLAEVIKTALDQIQYIAKTETVVGEPIQAGAVTLIPVSKVSIGFAAGGAGKEDASSTGAGTGGGITVIPIAFLAVTGDEVKVYPVAKNEPDLSSLLALAPEVVKKVAKFMGKKKEKEQGSETGESDDAE